jgi:hypothetical protein
LIRRTRHSTCTFSPRPPAPPRCVRHTHMLPIHIFVRVGHTSLWTRHSSCTSSTRPRPPPRCFSPAVLTTRHSVLDTRHSLCDTLPSFLDTRQSVRDICIYIYMQFQTGNLTCIFSPRPRAPPRCLPPDMKRELSKNFVAIKFLARIIEITGREHAL